MSVSEITTSGIQSQLLDRRFVSEEINVPLEAGSSLQTIDGSIFHLELFSSKFITEEYVSWLQDHRVNKYLIKANRTTTIEEAKRFCEEMINSEYDIFFAIVLKKNKKHIGNVRIGPIDFDSKVVQFSMMIGDSQFHNQGIGTKIVNQCIDYCFYKLGMRKFFVEVIDENKTAINIYEKNGLRTESMLKNHLLCHGKPANVLIMSRLKEEQYNPYFAPIC